MAAFSQLSLGQTFELEHGPLLERPTATQLAALRGVQQDATPTTAFSPEQLEEALRRAHVRLAEQRSDAPASQ